MRLVLVIRHGRGVVSLIDVVIATGRTATMRPRRAKKTTDSKPGARAPR